MTWARLDDQAWKNDRLLALSKDARLLWVFGLSFVGEGWPHNDGNIGASQASALARMQGVKISAIAELIDLGRWEKVDDGLFHVHDVEHFMPPKDLSEKRSQAGRVGAAVSNSRRAAIAEAGAAANAQQMLGKRSANSQQRVIPIPVPVPVSTSVANATQRARARTEGPDPALLEGFTTAWNENCHPLPVLLKPPASRDGQALVVKAVAYFDANMTQLGIAIRRAAADDLYRKNHHGFESFCRHVERWAPMGVAPSTPNGHRVDARHDAPLFPTGTMAEMADRLAEAKRAAFAGSEE